MRKKKGILVTALAGGLALAATSAEANGVLKVENGEDLVAKILQANVDPQIKNIKCIGHGACNYTGTLPTYTGTQHLKIDLKGSTIDASDITDKDAFSSTGGGRLRLMRINFIGGMSGVYVEVPADKEDDLRVDLHRVSIKGAAYHGLHIDDSANAAAGVRLSVKFSEFVQNGLEADEQDGLHVDETGDGQVLARVLHSSFRDNGSDGLSLDENGNGDVILTVIKGRFLNNGENPANPNDLEDGLDVDETGNGDVWFTILHSRFNENSDDGVDIDERDAGNLFGMMNHVEANNNDDLGLTFDERQVGTLNVTVKNSTVVDNDLSDQIDIVAIQQNGTGTLTLKKVTTGNVDVTGVNLITLP